MCALVCACVLLRREHRRLQSLSNCLDKLVSLMRIFFPTTMRLVSESCALFACFFRENIKKLVKYGE